MTNSEAQNINLDDVWNQAYANAAERLFGIVEGGTTTPEQDEICIAEADRELAEREN